MTFFGIEEPEESTPKTEITETVYMGEGEPDMSMDDTGKTEAAYMGEPEERTEPKHEKEYNKERMGPSIGKATLSKRSKSDAEKESA